MNDDVELLRQFATEGCGDAFARLVKRHVDLVYGTAKRRLQGDASLAEDVTQRVFVDLARQARLLPRGVVLGGWLHRHTGFVAGKVLRGEIRRRVREREAAAMNGPSDRSLLERLGDAMDQALDELAAGDRDALVLRYLEGRDLRFVGARLGLTEDAAQKRVSRALERLRSRLKRRGHALPAATLLALLAGAKAEAAPATLVATVTALPASAGGLAAALGSLALSKLPVLVAAGIVAVGGLATPFFLSDAPPATTQPGDLRRVIQTGEPSAATAPNSPVRRAVRAANTRAAPRSIAGLGRLRYSDLLELGDRLLLLNDPDRVVEELRDRAGLDIRPDEARRMLENTRQFLVTFSQIVAERYPREALAWLGSLSPTELSSLSWILNDLADAHPELIDEVPEGPTGIWRLIFLARRDPLSAGGELLKLPPSDDRREAFAMVGDAWPSGRAAEAVTWGTTHLGPQERWQFLGRILSRAASDNPDLALELLRQLQSQGGSGLALISAFRGLVEEHRRVADVLPLIDRLQGNGRAAAVQELARSWVRVDPEGLLRWLNDRRDPADFDAALPTTLPQLDEGSYREAMATLLPQLDGRLDRALIAASLPSHLGTNARSVAILDRLIARPEYAAVGAGQQGNAKLLWSAVHTVIDRWVRDHRGDPAEAAAWIDRIPFRTPGDKAIIAEALFEQWKVRDPAAAEAWARSAGVR